VSTLGGRHWNERPSGIVVSDMRMQPEVAAITPVADLAAVDSGAVFRRLSERHVQSAYRLAWAILGNEGEAQDAVQDSFAAAWRQRDTLRDAERFDAWFGRILVNRCRDRLRQRARHPERAPDDSEAVHPDHSHAILDRDELYREINRLDPDQRIVVILRFWKHLSVDEIAERLGVPSGTVKSRLSRSVARLRMALEDVS
jgi:RNA polymerase sigma-70 factor (ECF subfamily)